MNMNLEESVLGGLLVFVCVIAFGFVMFAPPHRESREELRRAQMERCNENPELFECKLLIAEYCKGR